MPQVRATRESASILSFAQFSQLNKIRTLSLEIRRIAVRSAAREPRQTCYGIKADLQAVAPFQEQWQGNPRLIHGEFAGIPGCASASNSRVTASAAGCLQAA